MAMQMLHFKKHDGVLSNHAPVGQLSTVPPELSRADAEGSKSSGDAQKSLVATSPQSECTRLNLGFGQPMVCAKYPYGDQLYGLFSSSGPQVLGRMMLPMNLTTDEGPIYVNARNTMGY